jgi:hypothetical protein
MPVVPMTPGVRPSARKIASSRNVVVVFPFVPVTPTTVIASAGCPKNAAEIGPIAARTSGTLIWGTSRSNQRSTTIAVDPRESASPAKAWPSAELPGTQKNRAPGRASSER